MSKREQKKKIEELIQQAIDCDFEGVEPLGLTRMQLRSLVDTALVLQERIWQVYRFKFLATFVLFGLTHELKPSDAMMLSRRIRNADDDDELFVEFFYMLQATYVDGLERGDDE